MKQEPMLPDIDPDIVIAELTELAEKYEAKRDARLKLLAEEIVLKAELIMMMDSYKLSVYRDGDLVVNKIFKENLKVKRTESDGDDDGKED